MSITKTALKKIPDSPGIYLFKDKTDKVIYIGRASSLKKRLASYFVDKKVGYHRPIEDLIKDVKDLDYKKTHSLLEAVILEANLIKEYWPKYNVRERDNRSFVYLVIPYGDFPKPLICRGREIEKFMPQANIFGPYQSYRILKNILTLIRRIFPYSTCDPNSNKPCFYYSIGLCPGICFSKISAVDYQKNIDNLILFFKGEKKRLFQKLKKENPDKITMFNQIQDVIFLERLKTEKMENFVKRVEGYDISHLSGYTPYGAMVVFIDGKPDISKYRHFKIKKAKANDDLSALEEVLERRLKHKEWLYPQLIVVDGGRNQINRVKLVLKRNRVVIPVVGISKSGQHSASSAKGDKLILTGLKKSLKDLILASRLVIQQVRNEAHRFAIGSHRKGRLRLKI